MTNRRSNFGNGSYLKAEECPACGTVGELVDFLTTLPRDLPIGYPTREDEWAKPIWFNVGDEDEHLSIRENDGAFD